LYFAHLYHDEQLNEQISMGISKSRGSSTTFLRASLDSLKEKLRSVASDLIEYSGGVRSVFEELRNIYGDIAIYCEHIEAPEEIHQVQQLKDAKFQIHQIWQSSMLDPQTLPFSLNEMPDVFTQFRQQVEKKKLRFAKPIEAPRKLPPLPNKLRMTDLHHRNIDAPSNALFIGEDLQLKRMLSKIFLES
jgi:deoxyribodipyrimidine photo-lyase